MTPRNPAKHQNSRLGEPPPTTTSPQDPELVSTTSPTGNPQTPNSRIPSDQANTQKPPICVTIATRKQARILGPATLKGGYSPRMDKKGTNPANQPGPVAPGKRKPRDQPLQTCYSMNPTHNAKALVYQRQERSNGSNGYSRLMMCPSPPEWLLSPCIPASLETWLPKDPNTKETETAQTKRAQPIADSTPPSSCTASQDTQDNLKGVSYLSVADSLT
jgi:hypothetical protein